MNLLLLDSEQSSRQLLRLSAQQTKHCLEVLKCKEGDTLRAGVVGEGVCSATICEISDGNILVSLSGRRAVPRPTTHVALALPRPKALSRIVSALASFGVDRLFLINAWRVERSYFSSPRLQPERLRHDARLGCEQGAQIWPPRIVIIDSFRRFVEDVTAATFPEETTERIVFQPDAPNSLRTALSTEVSPDTEILSVFGPEGGFIKQELASLVDAGYQSARLNTGPLRTEVAIAAALGQISLLRHD